MGKIKSDARAGEFWNINNKVTRGHKSLLTKRFKDDIEYIPTTHAPFYKRRRNKKLFENPEPNDVQDSYIVPKVHKGIINNLGKYHPDMRIKNATDKSVVRNIKKRHKKNVRMPET